jgi:glycosyltransferase involved in cell wall biosynthesis
MTNSMLSNPPTVSVVMTVYNAERYLEEAIASILTQTFEDFEFIIINDGSRDRSKEILEKLQQQDERIHIIHQVNAGVTAALNEGLRHARGRYIARMDADDVAVSERFAKQVAFLDTHPGYVAVGSQVLLIDPEGLPICPFSKKISHEEIDRAHMMAEGGAICHPAVMLRRKAVEQVSGYCPEMKSAQDIDLFLRLAEVGKLANLPEILLHYRMNPNSIGYTRRMEQEQMALSAVKNAYQRRGLQFELTAVLQYPNDEMHRRWTWWALQAGNLMTARKHVWVALRKNPISLRSWKAVFCVARGW